MNCPYCQLELKRDAHHCPRCGGPVGPSRASSGEAGDTRLRAAPIELDDRTTARSRLVAAAPSIPGNQPAEGGVWPDTGTLSAPSTPPEAATGATSTPVSGLTDAPASVRRLKALGLTAAAVGLISMIIALSSSAGLLSFIGGLVGAALYAYLPFKVAERKEWARIIIGVLAILGVLGNLAVVVSALGLMSMLGAMGGNYAAVVVLGVILALADAGLLVAIAANSLGGEAATWCRPAPEPFPSLPSNAATDPLQVIPSAGVLSGTETVTGTGAWLPTDTRTVVLWGLVGGVVAALLTEVYWWGADTWLPDLPSVLRVGLVGWGIAAPIATAHALFAGSKVGKPGATIATIAMTAVPFTIVASLLEPVLYGFEGGSAIWLDVIKQAVPGLLLVGVVGEVAQVLLKRLPDSLPVQALMGLSPVGGWMLFALVQRVLPVYGYPYGAGFGAGEWLTWVLLGGAFGYVSSGLVPAAILRRQAPLRSAQPMDGRAGPARGPGVVTPESSVGTSALPQVSQPEHPKANTVLVFGIVGIVAFAPLAIAAWVSGANAIREMREHPGRYRASGALQAGYVLGIIGTVLWILGVLLLVVVYGSIFAAMR